MTKHIVISILSISFFVQGALADCTPADMSFLGFTPTIIDFSTATSINVNYQISHGPFTGAQRCYYFAFTDYGAAANWTTRYLTHSTTGTTIPFNVYSRSTFGNGARIRLPVDATQNRHVVYTSPRFFNPSGSAVTNTNVLYARMGALPVVLEPGLYTESLIFRVAARLTNPPAGDWAIWPVVLSRAVQFVYRVEKELSLSIVATGDVFDPFSTAKLMSFGELDPAETRVADVIVKTNVGYRLKASSRNDGFLKHLASGGTIAYIFRAAGLPVNLVGSSSSPVVISSSVSNSPPVGFLIPVEVEIGAVTGTELEGEYIDVLSLSIEAF